MKTYRVASAGKDTSADESTTVTLNGTGSSDSEGSIVSYLWEQTQGTAVVLALPAAAITTFEAPGLDRDSTRLAFKVTVTDNDGLSTEDSVSIMINALPPTPAIPEAMDVVLSRLRGKDSIATVMKSLFSTKLAEMTP